jgi:hypothetical protein
MQRPDVRIGDAERDAAARELREHWSLGRLDAEELEERLETAYRAKTRRELDALIADLPELQDDSGRTRRRFFLPGVVAFHEGHVPRRAGRWNDRDRVRARTEGGPQGVRDAARLNGRYGRV